MISIQLIEKPKALTDRKVRGFINTFTKSGSSVWAKAYIKTALNEMFNEKCGYCEVQVNKEGYGAIDHFYPKKNYPDEVVNWGNLVLSCTRCNTNKSNFDTKKNPFINPFKDIPKEHLRFSNLTFFHKTIDGKNLIFELKFNDLERLEQRFTLEKSIRESLENILKNFKAFQKNKNIEGFNNCIEELSRVLSTASPKKEYSAITANLILNNSAFQLLKKHLETENLWNSELQKLENQAVEITL